MAEIPDPTEELFTLFPDAPLTQDNIEVYRGRLDRRLLVHRCRACTRFHAPPRSFCPDCLSRDVVAEPVSGRATAALFSRVHAGPAGFGIDYDRGHPIVVADLVEQPGLRVSAHFATPEDRDAVLGEELDIVWEERAGSLVPAFAPTTQPEEAP